MNWYNSLSNTRPQIVDDTISKKWVYVRRNIKRIEIKDVLTGEMDVYYSFEEVKIPKDIYVIFEEEKNNSNRLDDIEETIVEMLYGGE